MASTTVHRDQRLRDLVRAIDDLATLEEGHAAEQERFTRDYLEKVNMVKRAARRLSQITGYDLDYAMEDFELERAALQQDARSWRVEAAKLSRQ